jgi:hypothetical protein
MVATMTQGKTNGHFLEILLETEASMAVDAKKEIGDFLQFQWAKDMATEETIGSAVEIFSERIYPKLDSLKIRRDLYKEKLADIRRFFGEVLRIAAGFGLKVNLKEANNNLGQS